MRTKTPQDLRRRDNKTVTNRLSQRNIFTGGPWHSGKGMHLVIIRSSPTTPLTTVLSLLLVFSVKGAACFSVDESRRSLLLTSATTTVASFLAIPFTTRTTTMASSTTGNNNIAAESKDGIGTTTPPNIRWGIVGLGDVTEKKSGPPFFKATGCELVAVMRRTPGKAAEWAQRVVPGGHCQGYDNLTDFLQHEPALDAVYVSTRPGTHLEQARLFTWKSPWAVVRPRRKPLPT